MEATNAVLERFQTILETGRPSSSSSVWERIAAVLNHSSCIQSCHPSQFRRGPNQHLSSEALEDIRRLAFGKLPLRELLLIAKSATDRNGQISGTVPRLFSKLRNPRPSAQDSGLRKKRPSAGCRRLRAESFEFESIQLGRFFVSHPRRLESDVPLSNRTNYIRISRPHNSLIYYITCERDGHSYYSAYQVPFPIINRMFTTERSVFIRLDSCALFRFCYCDGRAVNVDVTNGERSNALFHHIVLRGDAQCFSEQLLRLNQAYFSKITQPLNIFLEGTLGTWSTEALRKHAKSIISQNSRVPPPKRKSVEFPISHQRQRFSDHQKVQGNLSKDIIVNKAMVEGDSNKTVLSSRYSLEQIPGMEQTIPETPLAKLNPYLGEQPAATVSTYGADDCVDYIHGVGVATQKSHSESDPLTLRGIPLRERISEDDGQDQAVPNTPQQSNRLEVPTLYWQSEYKSCDQELNGTTPTRTDDLPNSSFWSSMPSYPYEDDLEFLFRDDHSPLLMSDTEGYGLPIISNCEISYGYDNEMSWGATVGHQLEEANRRSDYLNTSQW
ncbi:hypothetical protein Q1695_014906 [Nippostrongylus brasiliensis]|nr:hypothetical protein Q1695_014906 [Nippostrongylus brasiliensis]